jgi:hypothetical protein
MNVAYEMDFDIEGFLKSVECKARTAPQRRDGRTCATRRDAVHDRKSEHVEKGLGSEQRARRTQVERSRAG